MVHGRFYEGLRSLVIANFKQLPRARKIMETESQRVMGICREIFDADAHPNTRIQYGAREYLQDGIKTYIQLVKTNGLVDTLRRTGEEIIKVSIDFLEDVDDNIKAVIKAHPNTKIAGDLYNKVTQLLGKQLEIFGYERRSDESGRIQYELLIPQPSRSQY